MALANILGSTQNFNSVGPPTTLVLTTTATAVVGEFIVVLLGSHRTGILSSVVDSAGNTYALDVNTTSGQNSNFYIASAQVTTQLTSGGTITATWAAGVANRLMGAASFNSIVTSSALDKTAKQNQTNTAAWSSGATATTAQADELVIGGGTINSAAVRTSTPDASLTELFDLGTSDAVSLTGAYKIVSSTGTYTANGTWSAVPATTLETSAVATYKAAVGGGATAEKNFLTLLGAGA